MLLDVKSLGLIDDPLLAVVDGALGFWKALSQVWPTTMTQRCWVHMAKSIVSKLPKRLHGAANDQLRQIWMAPTEAAANTRLICSSRRNSPSTPRRPSA